MLMQRVITALILAPLSLWGIWVASSSVFALILGLIFAMAAWEWARLSGMQRIPARLAYVVLVSLLMLGLYLAQSIHNFSLMILVLGLMWWSMALMSVLSYPDANGLWRNSPLARGLAGLFVLLPAWLAIVVLHAHGEQGPLWVILLVMMVWAADTGAYFAGRAFGRHKLAPRVSPGKTWEGVVGGMALALLIALAGSYWLDLPGSLLVFALLVLASILISVLGDLLESLFKRITDIKDSGGMLPGHGGILDRIDSLTAAAPLFVLGLLWLG
ncbi:MAG: phosphatidate cytidylyltransferase [Chromatiales bacterium]|nr:phosphatidate cytidylyltransferase [Chromatiales bacterium]